MADNLRALAKQSWDSVFDTAYPKLANMIRSINEEMARTLEDSKREIRSTTLNVESFEQKLITTKNNISSLVRSQDSINSYLSRISDNFEKMIDGGGSQLPTPDLKDLVKSRSAATAAGAVAGRTPMGLGLKALLAVTGLAGAAGVASMYKSAKEDTKTDGTKTEQSGSVAGALSSADSIRFVADKIIFKSSQGGQGERESPSAGGGGGGSMGGGGGGSTSITTSSSSSSSSISAGGKTTHSFQSSYNIDRSPTASGFGQSSGQLGGGQQFMGGGMFPQSYGSQQPRSSGGGSNLRYDATQSGSRSNVTPTISQGEYYNKMYAAVYEAAKQRGLPNPEVIASIGAAQTSLETGYGKHMVGNNAFGIKGSGPAGTVNANTQEFVNGRMVGMKQGFRAYGDVTESANDYVDMMLKNQKRYGGVLNATSVEEAIAAQAKSGYATDPAYGSKLASINSKFAGSPSKNVATKPEPKSPASGPAVNKASIESKVDKEKQQTASMEVNNLVSQSPSSQSGDKQTEQPTGKEVGANDRIGRLITPA